MAATLSTDWAFEPKVWHDHVDAYFGEKLMFGAFAMRDTTLEGQPGLTVNFPYFKMMGDVEEPAETDSLAVDNLEDDSFLATIKEVGKAVGFKKKSLRASAAKRDRLFAEAQRQMGIKFAKKVDDDLKAEVVTSGNYETGFTATAAAHVANVANINTAKFTAFGDKQDEAVAIFLHSTAVLSLMNDGTSGFLKADANDPLWGVSGFRGRLLGMAIMQTDKMAQVADVDGKKAYEAVIIKPNAYGICSAEQLMFETDRDILAREDVVAATMWYAVKAFHGKVDAEDKRICRATFASTIAA